MTVSFFLSCVQWLARLLVLTSVASAVGLTWVFHWGLPRHPVLELLRYLPFLLYLAPAVVGLALSLSLGWWWRMSALLAVGWMLGGVMDASLGLHPNRTEKPVTLSERRVRFMTYNIKAYRAAFRPGGFDDLAEEIQQHQPDILVMQDALNIAPRGTLQPSLKAALPDHKWYAYGQYAVMSRFPLSGCSVGDMSYKGEKHEYVRCTVTVDGVAVDVVTAHLLTPREGLNATRHEWLAGLDDWQDNFAARLTQADALVRDLGPLRRPTVLAGDLNAPEHSLVVQSLLALGLRDAYSAAGRGWGFSYGHSLKPGISFLRIDHVLVSGDIGVERAEVGSLSASEHRPVITDLRLPAAALR